MWSDSVHLVLMFSLMFLQMMPEANNNSKVVENKDKVLKTPMSNVDLIEKVQRQENPKICLKLK